MGQHTILIASAADQIGLGTFGAKGEGTHFRQFFRFTIPAEIRGGSASSATLDLRLVGYGTAGASAVILAKSTASTWTKTNSDPTDFNAMMGVTITPELSRLTVPTTYNWYSWDVLGSGANSVANAVSSGATSITVLLEYGTPVTPTNSVWSTMASPAIGAENVSPNNHKSFGGITNTGYEPRLVITAEPPVQSSSVHSGTAGVLMF